MRWMAALTAAVAFGGAAVEQPAAAAPATNAPAADAEKPAGRVGLFNGKDFAGLVRFLPGTNADVNATWQVKDGVIQCTGKPSGYPRTETAYRDYVVHVEWRWTGKPGNSGVLVHMSEPDQVWPKSIECQLMSRNAGDFFVIEGTEFNEHKGKEGRRVPKKDPTNEKPPGEWNTMEVTCAGDTLRIVVNGLPQNQATGCSVGSGHLCFQSEGAPIEFRNIFLEPAK
jgi:hypothetical protein